MKGRWKSVGVGLIPISTKRAIVGDVRVWEYGS